MIRLKHGTNRPFISKNTINEDFFLRLQKLIELIKQNYDDEVNAIWFLPNELEEGVHRIVICSTLKLGSPRQIELYANIDDLFDYGNIDIYDYDRCVENAASFETRIGNVRNELDNTSYIVYVKK